MEKIFVKMKLMKKVYMLLIVFLLAVSSQATATMIKLQPGSAGKDAYISSDSPTVNYGDINSMVVDQRTTIAKYSLIEFDLSGIPVGATVNSATFGLYLHYNLYTGTKPIDAYQVTSSWVENTVDWNSQPTVGAIVASTSVTTGKDKWVTWDLRSLTQSWLSGTPNYGVELRAPSANVIRDFWSSDATTTNMGFEMLHPYLEINYEQPIPEPTTMALLGIGLAGLGGRYFRRKRKKIAD